MVGEANGYIKRDDSHLNQVGVSGNGESGYIDYTTNLAMQLIESDVLNWDKKRKVDFPGGPVVKNLPANAGDMGSIPSLGRFHMLWSN